MSFSNTKKPFNGKNKPLNANNQNTRKREIQLLVGVVKAVPSGDSVMILEMDGIRKGGPKEILFTFLGLKAPQLGRRTPEGKTQDDPFAWQSREFLRNFIIGQPVIYRIEHHDQSSDRHYGELWDNKENDLRQMIVENGWADVIIKARKNKEGNELEPTLAQQQLETALNEAKAKKKGMWNTNQKDAIRKVKYVELYKDPRYDTLNAEELFEFYKNYKDKGPLNGVVESVKTGSQLNILLTDTMEHVPVIISGIRCPGLNKKNEPELYMREARFITEYYLLHRNVTVTLESIDKLNIYATVLLDEGTNIAYDLLQMGLAQFVEWSAPKNNRAVVERLKEDEKSAQENKKRLWRTFHKPSTGAVEKPSKKGDKMTKERSVINGKVVEIMNAGVISVRVTTPQKTVDRIISLSSIRPPRIFRISDEPPKPAPRGSDKPLSPEEQNKLEEAEKKQKELLEADKRENAHAIEAKEFLRNLLIGQKVRCVFDYMKPIIQKNQQDEKSNPPKLFWTVYFNEGGKEKNVAIELVRQGLSKVSSHSEEEPRSADYQELVLVEKEAMASNKGLHSPIYKKAANRLNDLTPPPLSKDEEGTGDDNNKASSGGKRRTVLIKCKQFLGHLQRTPKLDAIVEYVATASRYKLVIPSQSCVITFNLQACIVEKPDRVTIPPSSIKPDISLFDKQFPPTSHGNKALHFARDHIFQRKVQISVTNLDSFGIFSGSLYVNGKDFSLILLENGHARLHNRAYKKLSNSQVYKDAEDRAKKALVGYWSDYDFEAEEAQKKTKETSRQTQQSEVDEFPLTITDFRSGGTFSYQILNNNELSSLKELADYLQKEGFGKLQPYAPKEIGETVSAQFTADDKWYRAQIVADNKVKGKQAEEATQWEVRYIDYGNREFLKKDRIRQLPQPYTKLPPQAHDGKLYGVKAPLLESDFGTDSAETFRELVWGKNLTGQEMNQEKGKGKGSSAIHHLILKDEERSNINVEMVKSGFAHVDKYIRDDAFGRLLHEVQEQAHTERAGIWQCGYYPDSDEERELEKNLLR